MISQDIFSLESFSAIVVIEWFQNKLEDWVNRFPHTSYLNGFSLVWTLIWFLSKTAWLKAYSQNSHLNGFDPECVSMCLVSTPDWVNFLAHKSHLHRFSPLWIRRCLVKSPFALKLFSQYWHSKGFDILWTFIWTANVDKLCKSAPTWSQCKPTCITQRV